MKKEEIKNLEDALQYITEIEELQDSKTIEIIRYKYYGLTGREIGDIMGTNVKHVEYKTRVIRKKLNNVSGALN